MKLSGLGPGTIASGKILGLIDGRRVRGREHYTLMPFDLYIRVTEFCNIIQIATGVVWVYRIPSHGTWSHEPSFSPFNAPSQLFI